MRTSCLLTASVLAAAMWGNTAVAVGQSATPEFLPGGGADPLQSVVEEHLKAYRTLTNQSTRLAQANTGQPVSDANSQTLGADEDDRSIATLVEDAAITAAIKTKLVWDDPEQTFDVSVMTRRGVVTLSGEADSIHARVMAEDIAQRTDGVLEVINEIKVNEVAAVDDPTFTDIAAHMVDATASSAGQLIKTGSELVGEQTASVDDTIDDAWITAQVKAELLASDTVDGLEIAVDTRGGLVSLRGEVPDVETKALAVRAANGVEGVIGVDAVGLKVRATASTS